MEKRRGFEVVVLDIRQKQGRLDEAEAYYKESLAIRRPHYSEDHRVMIRTLQSLVEIYEATGRPGSAAAYRALLPKQASTPDAQ